MPIESMARRGLMTLAYGLLKPVGLKDPRTESGCSPSCSSGRRQGRLFIQPRRLPNALVFPRTEKGLSHDPRPRKGRVRALREDAPEHIHCFPRPARPGLSAAEAIRESISLGRSPGWKATWNRPRARLVAGSRWLAGSWERSRPFGADTALGRRALRVRVRRIGFSADEHQFRDHQTARNTDKVKEGTARFDRRARAGGRGKYRRPAENSRPRDGNGRNDMFEGTTIVAVRRDGRMRRGGGRAGDAFAEHGDEADRQKGAPAL